MELLGLDVGTSHIKVVSIDRDKKNKLKKYAIGSSKSILNKILSESESDLNVLAKSVKNFLLSEEIFTRQAVGIIPDNKVFTKLIRMPYIQGKEFDDAVHWEAEEHLPERLSDVYLKYTVISDNKSSESGGILKKFTKNNEDNDDGNLVDVLLVAVPKHVVNKYLGILTKAGLEPVGLEPASTAVVRSLIYNEETASIPTIIADIGYSNVCFSLTVDGNVRFVRTINFAIASMVNIISKELDMSNTQATEYLYTYGMKETELDGKIRAFIKPVVDIIIEELKKSINFVERKSELIGKHHDKNRSVKRIIVNGGGALIPDLIFYFVQELSVEIEVANPWNLVTMSPEMQNSKLIDFGPLFSTSVGAALKNI